MRRAMLIIFFCLLYTSVKAQTWKQKTSSPVARSDATAFMINDKVYVAGGYGTDDLSVYDLPTDKWSSLSEIPGSTNGRAGAISFVVNGKGYIGLGADALGNFYKDLYEYNPVTNQWVSKKSLPATGREGAGCFVINNKAYVIGGAETARFPDVWEYDPAGDTWTKKKDYIDGPIIYAFSFAVNNRGYISCGNPGANVDTKTFEYDPGADKWIAKAPFPGAARQEGVAFIIQDKAYCGLGRALSLFSPFKDMYQYDPVTDTWKSSGDFPGDARYSATAISNGTNAFVGSGAHGTTDYADWWEYSLFPSKMTELYNNDKFQCYPNPSTDVLYVRLPTDHRNDNVFYSLCSLSGKCAFGKIVASKQAIKVDHLSPGIYILEVVSQENISRMLVTIK